jgi:hypothetical protein
LIQNPILKVLSTMSCHTVRHLLIGGQACVLYGAAEFSRDCDLVIQADPANFEKLNSALAELRAELIAIPEFKAEYLERGHAVHFRCHHPDVESLRIDVMTKMRGCESRTPRMISELLNRFPEKIAAVAIERPWLAGVDATDSGQIESWLRQEEDGERRADEAYWMPLKMELAQLRKNRERRGG